VSQVRSGEGELSDRQRRVLEAIVTAYVRQAVPIGSATISHVLPTKLSSASIRATLAELSEMGLVEQPHTSAGRVPTEDGLRFFIDELMNEQEVAEYDRRTIAFGMEEAEAAAVSRVAARLLSERTQQLGFVVAPKLDRIVLQHVSFVRLTTERVLAVLVSSTGVAYRRVLDGDEELDQARLDRIATLLNERVRGRNLGDVRDALAREARALRREADRLLAKAIELGKRALSADGPRARSLRGGGDEGETSRGARSGARGQRRERGAGRRAGSADPAPLRPGGDALRRRVFAAGGPGGDRAEPDGLRSGDSPGGLLLPGDHGEAGRVSGDERRGRPGSAGAAGAQPAEGWESLAEDAEEGTLGLNPELEAALREAAESVPDPDAGTGGEVPREEPLAASAAEQEVARLLQEVTDANDRMLRLQADFDNFRKRAHRDRQEALQYGSQNLVKDLLSVVDNLDRAIDHARQSGGGDLQSLLQGVELVQREFLGMLAKHHVNEIDALGKSFNPALHEAMAQVSETSVEPNSVVEVLQKGYQLRDRLVRPSRVVVSRMPESGEAGGGEATD
jgi:transcriptional regulator of heat shock response